MAMRPETVFRLASLTKQVTALLVMQQVEQGTSVVVISNDETPDLFSTYSKKGLRTKCCRLCLRRSKGWLIGLIMG